MQIVTEWLQQHGVTQIEDLSDWVCATMTVAQAEKLLQVSPLVLNVLSLRVLVSKNEIASASKHRFNDA